MKKRARPERTWINVALPLATHARLARYARAASRSIGSRVTLGEIVRLALAQYDYQRTQAGVGR